MFVGGGGILKLPFFLMQDFCKKNRRKCAVVNFLTVSRPHDQNWLVFWKLNFSVFKTLPVDDDDDDEGRSGR